MKKAFLVMISIVLLLGIAGEAGFAQGSDASFNINAIGARKQLSSDWQPADQQDEFGVDVDMKGKDWPFSLNGGYLYATQKGTANQIIRQGDVSTAYTDLKRTGITEEIYAGLKKIWADTSGLCFFVAGGADWIRADVDFEAVSSFSDSKVGWYASTGLYYTILHFLNLGAFVRYSDVRLTLFNTDLNAGGWHYGVLAGIHF